MAGRVFADTSGREWLMLWGTWDPGGCLETLLGFPEPRTSHMVELVRFHDPVYPDETKTLGLYQADKDDQPVLWLEGEITAGVYAVGVPHRSGETHRDTNLVTPPE